MKKKIVIAAFAASLVATAIAPANAALTGTVNKGVLTIATDNPAYSPWFDSNKPSNGKGYESAVAYAVAKQLGYSANQVKWVTATFDSVIQPGKKNYDFDINQVSITDERKKAVDFSTGYYDVAQSVVSIKGSKIAGAKSLAALKDAKFGAAAGTTSLNAINKTIKPKSAASVYNTNDLAVAALSAKQIDGIVVDLPTAFYLAATVKDAVLVGQLPASGTAEQFGLVLTKGSPLTAKVSAAVDALRKNGTLAKLADKWLANTAGAPVLK
jgi:polar amino acid transport system substrate-binding protein